ncbi:NAD(P)H-binding protein [Yinghuangia aomiensis]
MKTLLVLGGTAPHCPATGGGRTPGARLASRTGGDARCDLERPVDVGGGPRRAGLYACWSPTRGRASTGTGGSPGWSVAAAAGVRRVLLSAHGVGRTSAHPLKAAEQAVRASGMDWTILRPDWSAQNFPSRRSGAPAILAEPWRCRPATAAPFVDDIADVAAAAFTDARHASGSTVLTGPTVAAYPWPEIGKAAGRTVRHVDVTAEAFVEQGAITRWPGTSQPGCAACWAGPRRPRVGSVRRWRTRGLGDGRLGVRGVRGGAVGRWE